MSSDVPSRVGPYEIRAVIGRGGMAAVYKGYQASLDRIIALKVISAHLASEPEFMERFRQEALAIARLTHPNIVTVHDFGEENGLPYLVMEFVDGETLAEMFDNGVPHAEVEPIIRQIAAGLDYAHSRGVVHRDIKPQNVLVTSEGRAVLADFGLARIMESTQRLTMVGGIVGTPEYMSPEQAAGRPSDHRTDIYALGVILFEMVAGLRPFTAETPLGVLMKHIQEPIPQIREMRPDLPSAVEDVIRKALAKNPDERFQRAGDLAAAFRDSLASSEAQPARAEQPAPPPAAASLSNPPDIDISKYSGLRATAEKSSTPHETPSMARLRAVRPPTQPPAEPTPPPAAPEPPPQPTTRTCPDCGAEIALSESMCPKCFYMLPFEEVASRPPKPQFVREEVRLNLLPYSLRWDGPGLERARQIAQTKANELTAAGWQLAVPLDSAGTLIQGRSAGGAIVQQAVLVVLRPA